MRSSLIKRKKMVLKKKKVKEIQKEMKEECKAMDWDADGEDDIELADEFKAEEVEKSYNY